MWRILLGDDYLHAPDLGIATDDPVLTKALNAADSLTFTIHPDHPLYARCRDGVLSEGYSVHRDGDEVSRGRILSRVVRPFDAACEVECEGELAYLNDALVMEYDFSGTPSALMGVYLDAYNSQCGEGMEIHRGTVDDTLDPNGYIVRGSDTPVRVMEEMLSKTVNSATGGVLELRHENGTRYLDWIAAPTATGRQAIEKGANLLDISDTLDGSAIVTAIMPLGSHETGEYVRLPEGADGQVSGDVWRKGDYLYSKTLVDAYGWHADVRKWDDVTLSDNLRTKAIRAVRGLAFAPSFEISAVDLTDAGYDTDALEVGQPVPVTCGDISETTTITQAEWHLSDPSQSSYTFGKLAKSTDSDQAQDSAGWSGAADNGNYFWHKSVEHDDDENTSPWHEDNSYASPHAKGDIDNWFWPTTGDPNVSGTYQLPGMDMWWEEQHNNIPPRGGVRLYTADTGEVRANGTVSLVDMTGSGAYSRVIADMNADGSEHNGNPYVEFLNGTELYIDGSEVRPMSILSYGSSTWADFIAAYNTNSVVYCRASSNSNPASGSQTRLAFMAYVDNDASPTSVEFQYYRSVSSHTASQQGDQVYVYKLTSSGAWSVTVREASVKVAAGDGLDMTYASGTATLSLGSEVGSRVTHDQSTAVSLTSGTWGEICNVSLDAGTWVVHGNVQHASNATGRRGACLSTDASAPTTGDLRQRGLQVPPVNGAATMLNTCITVKLSAATTMRLYGLQTSGAANNAVGCITAVRIV